MLFAQMASVGTTNWIGCLAPIMIEQNGEDDESEDEAFIRNA